MLRLRKDRREPFELEGATIFLDPADGIEWALDQAKAAAAGKDVSLAGGAEVIRQYTAADSLGEMISVVPLLLEDGARLFGNLGTAHGPTRAAQGNRGAGRDSRTGCACAVAEVAVNSRR